jgi:outer membrane biosynthesis protein TonB
LIRDTYNIIPFIMAVLFHVLIFSGLMFVIDFSRPAPPSMPLAINATLVAANDIPRPPRVVREPEPEPEPVVPDPEPVVPEPEPEPDRAEEERKRLEEEKRQADLRAEQQRIREQ